MRPPPKFILIRREPGLQETIWVVKRRNYGTFVGRSVPAICRELSKRGAPAWPSGIYRPNQKYSQSFRCKDADEVNEALAGVDEATFILADPRRWFIEAYLENATTDMGERDT